MIEIIQAVRSIMPATELTFLSLHMYLYSKVYLQYPRKNKHKNYQWRSGKCALVTNEGATVNTWASFTMVLEGTYLFTPNFLKNML